MKEIQKILAWNYRQKGAGTLSRPHGVYKTDFRKRHIFQAKYFGICLTNTSN